MKTLTLSAIFILAGMAGYAQTVQQRQAEYIQAAHTQALRILSQEGIQGQFTQRTPLTKDDIDPQYLNTLKNKSWKKAKASESHNLSSLMEVLKRKADMNKAITYKLDANYFFESKAYSATYEMSLAPIAGGYFVYTTILITQKTGSLILDVIFKEELIKK